MNSGNFSKEQIGRATRRDQLNFWNFTGRVESPEVGFKIFLNSLSSTAWNLDESVVQLLTSQFSTMTPEQVALNRDANEEEVALLLDLMSGDEWDWGKRFPAFDAESRERKRLLTREVESNVDRMNDYPWLVSYLIPTNPRFVKDSLELEALRRIAIAELALRLQAIKSKPPNLIKALADQGASEFAIDPFSGEPLNVIEREGEIIVYSVGPNLQDDQATPLKLLQGKILLGDVMYVSR